MADNPSPGSGQEPERSRPAYDDGSTERMEYTSERAERRIERARERAERHAARGTSGAWIGGLVLIVLGLVFLAQNFGISTLNNWWALFILIPAVGSLATAWNLYQANDSHLTHSARGALISGLVLLVITAAFLFGLNWGLVIPLLLILAGIAALLSAVVP